MVVVGARVKLGAAECASVWENIIDVYAERFVFEKLLPSVIRKQCGVMKYA